MREGGERGKANVTFRRGCGAVVNRRFPRPNVQLHPRDLASISHRTSIPSTGARSVCCRKGAETRPAERRPSRSLLGVVRLLFALPDSSELIKVFIGDRVVLGVLGQCCMYVYAREPRTVRQRLLRTSGPRSSMGARSHARRRASSTYHEETPAGDSLQSLEHRPAGYRSAVEKRLSFLLLERGQQHDAPQVELPTQLFAQAQSVTGSHGRTDKLTALRLPLRSSPNRLSSACAGSGSDSDRKSVV